MIFSNDEWPGGNNLASTPAIWRKMYEILPDANFGLNLDPSHLIWQMIDPARVVYEFKERLFHIHAKDMMIDREGLYQNGVLSLGMGWQVPRLPGLGEVDWRKFIAALYAVGYDYVLSVEHEDRAFEKTEELIQRGFLIARDALKPYIH
jgi:sugar phosphate isomerase/epimerase